MKKTKEKYVLDVVTTEDLLPIKVILYRDFLGAMKIKIPERFIDKDELTRILRTIADEIDREFPNYPF